MLKCLPPDNTAVFPIPFLSEDDTFVRKGMHADGSCFLHAVAYATRKRDYKAASLDTRATMISNMRKELAERATIETMQQLADGEVYRMLYLTAVRKQIEEHPLELAPVIDAFEKASSDVNNFYSVFTAELKKIPDKKNRLTAMHWLFDRLSAAHDDVVHDFQQSLLNDEIQSVHIEYISRAYGLNFCFIRYTNEQGPRLYPDVSSFLSDSKPYVFILWLENEQHYELLGRYEKDRRTTCLFEPTDPVVQQVQAARGGLDRDDDNAVRDDEQEEEEEAEAEKEEL